MIEMKERFVTQNCDALRKYYETSTTKECTRHWECDYDLYTSATFLCSSGFGDDSICTCNNSLASVSLDSSAIRFGPKIYPHLITDDSSLTFICSNPSLTTSFHSNYNEDPTTVWQYVGSPTGIFITHPNRGGKYRDWNATTCKIFNDQCKPYDPRIRPWYTAASSGTKSIVMLLDNSMSMLKYERFKRGKEALNAVIGTVALHDKVFVGNFASGVSGCSEFLLNGNKTNKNKLKSCVQSWDLSIHPGSNFEIAFEYSFNILMNQATFSQCHYAILFLTDGIISKGSEGEDLIKFIALKNEQFENIFGKKVHIFTFSMGKQTNHDTLQRISCANEGVWHSIEDEGDYNDLRNEMANYYQYFVYSNRTRGVTWSEKYFDFSGLGWMTTAAKGCFNKDGSILYGVAGVDVLLSDFYDPLEGKTIEHFYDDHVNPILLKNSKKCDDLEIPSNILEELRKDHKCYADDTLTIWIIIISIGSFFFLLAIMIVGAFACTVMCYIKLKDRNKFDRMMKGDMEMEGGKKYAKLKITQRFTKIKQSILSGTGNNDKPMENI